MYEIDFDKKFTVEVNLPEYYDRDVYLTYTDFLKSILLSWDSDIRKWVVPYKRIDEILLWFITKKKDYVLSEEAKAEFINFQRDNFVSETIFKRSGQFDPSVLKEDVKLYNYQEEGVNWLLKRSSAYLADDAGLGKTIQIVSVVSHLYKYNLIDAVLLVVRNSLEYNWLKEFVEKSSIFSEDDIAIIQNDSKLKPFENYRDKKIIIISNHLYPSSCASYRKDYFTKKKLSKMRWNKSFVDINKEWGKESICFIADESHELKNTKAVRTKAVLSTKAHFPYRYYLSATPAINYFEDWWAGMNFIDQSIIPMSENAFKIYISKEIGNKWSMYNINTYDEKKINEVRKRFDPHVLKRLKRDLPEVKTTQTVKPIYLRMNDKHTKLYQSFIQNEVLKLADEFDSITLRLIFQKFPYLIQIVDNPALLEGKVINKDVNEKLNKWKSSDDCRVDYIKNALSSYIGDLDEKVIIFDNHPKTLNMLGDLFKKYDPLIVHGEMKDSKEDRWNKQKLFNDKKSKHKLFLLNTSIGGAGWNLHEACRRIIFYTLPYDATLTRQALDRVWRVNSEYDSIVEILLLDHSLDNIR